MERCAEILQVATGGVLLESADGGFRLAASTSEEVQVLEEAEISHEEGPCLDSYRHCEQVTANDLAEKFDRWPTIAPMAVDIGLVAVYAFPLRLRDDTIGALNLYRQTAGAFEDDDIRLAQAFAHMAAIGILQQRKVQAAEERSEQLQHALNSRVAIEQAKGVLAERADISTTDAFNRMRSYARSHNEKLQAVCTKVVDTDFVPD